MDFNRIWRGGRGVLEDPSRISRIPRGFLDDLASKTMNSRPAGARRDWPELAGAAWAWPSPLAGLKNLVSGTWPAVWAMVMRGPHIFHTFQRRSNRGRATILDQSSDGDEISVKGKSLIPLTSGAPTGAANGSNLQSEIPLLDFH